MVDCVICQKSHFDWQPVSGPLKTLAVLCLCTDGWSSEWHIHTCGEDLCYQSGWLKTPNCLVNDHCPYLHTLFTTWFICQKPLWTTSFCFFFLFKLMLRLSHYSSFWYIIWNPLCFHFPIKNKKDEKQFHTNIRFFVSVICLSTWCEVGVLTYLKPGENLSRRSLLLLQDVPGQSSCVWRGSQSQPLQEDTLKPLPLLSTTNHLRSMEVKTCAHTLTYRVISDSYWFFFMCLTGDDAL